MAFEVGDRVLVKSSMKVGALAHAGRAGKAGRTGQVMMLITPEQPSSVQTIYEVSFEYERARFFESELTMYRSAHPIEELPTVFPAHVWRKADFTVQAFALQDTMDVIVRDPDGLELFKLRHAYATDGKDPVLVVADLVASALQTYRCGLGTTVPKQEHDAQIEAAKETVIALEMKVKELRETVQKLTVQTAIYPGQGTLEERERAGREEYIRGLERVKTDLDRQNTMLHDQLAAKDAEVKGLEALKAEMVGRVTKLSQERLLRVDVDRLASMVEVNHGRLLVGIDYGSGDDTGVLTVVERSDSGNMHVVDTRIFDGQVTVKYGERVVIEEVSESGEGDEE